MRRDIEAALRKFENKHFAAVQTDTILGERDDWKIEKKSKQFWQDFADAKRELYDLLETVA